MTSYFAMYVHIYWCMYFSMQGERKSIVKKLCMLPLLLKKYLMVKYDAAFGKSCMDFGGYFVSAKYWNNYGENMHVP